MTGIEYLKTLHTKQLLALKNDYYRAWIIKCSLKIGDVVITYDELKQVLNARPHLPNKLDTKRIRQLSAKSKTRLYESVK